MEKRRLGQSDLDISILGMGTWAIGGDIGEWGWGAQSKRNSLKAIHAAFDNGMNWIDTAPAYGLGNAEEVVGEALRQMPVKPLVFTKCGFRWQQGQSELTGNLSRASIEEEVDASLQRLGIDCIDLYQIHMPSPEHEIETAWQVLQALKVKGKVRHIGVSNFSVAQLERINRMGELVSTQPGYSLVNREVEEAVLPWCLSHKVGTIHHSTMSNGLLSGRWSQERLAALDPRDWRHKSHQFQEPTFSRNLAFIEFLKEMAASKACSVAQLSIAWTLANPASTAAIIGARTPVQLKGLIGAAEVKLTADELLKIDHFQQ
ncbi:aldo/keto reductase [Thaumasiovibrio subtropicus]|uniref:aldo/keto reductase n=1 Tax=Thaumasiovibrio subtropicus TaxID=1891207 RepID=UPI000B35062E|nr:aldo/keto reductase [Thaumasiovibrio subtropicus]